MFFFNKCLNNESSDVTKVALSLFVGFCVCVPTLNVVAVCQGKRHVNIYSVGIALKEKRKGLSSCFLCNVACGALVRYK